MNREQVLENMREIYREGKLEELKRTRIFASFMLSDEEKEKIDMAIKKLENQNPLIQKARDILT